MESEISPKSRAVDAILAFLVGFLGVHRFYEGKIATGVIMVLLTISFFLIFVSAVWAFIDFIIILIGNGTDKQGRKILNWSD